MAQKGDFIGFTFNGRHSSSFGIVRTSNGSRFNTNLLPQSQDQTVAVPGGDGVYFFGSNYTTRSFQLQIASDEISEPQMREIQQWLGDKQLHELIFDEIPYKIYTAKCTGMPQFNFICFDENGGRVYKGEGSIEFTAYYPYAKSRYKFLDEYMKQVSLSEAPADWTGYFYKVGNEYFSATSYVNGRTYYKGLPEWWSVDLVPKTGIFHNHVLSGANIIFIYSEWEYDEESWESMYNYLYVKQDGEYVQNNNSEYNSEITYYTRTTEEIDSENYCIGVNYLYNLDEWNVTSGMRNTKGNLDTPTGINAGEKNIVYVYNPGDIDADFQLWFVPQNATSLLYYTDASTPDYFREIKFDFSDVDFSPEWELGKYYEQLGEDNYVPLTQRPLEWSTDYYEYFYKSGNVYYPVTAGTIIQYDSKTELFTGYISLNTTNGKLYNKYITSGDFFKIPKMDFISNTTSVGSHIKLVADNMAPTTEIKQIKYDYLYY